MPIVSAHFRNELLRHAKCRANSGEETGGVAPASRQIFTTDVVPAAAVCLSVCLSDSTHQIMAAGGAATTGMSRDTNSQDGGFDRRRPRDFDDVTRAPYVTSTSDLGSWHCDAAIGHYWYSDRSCSSVRPFPFRLLNQPTKQPMNFIFACVWIMTQLVTPRPIGQRSIVMSVSVCVSLCVCVCLSTIISSELHVRSSPFLCVLYMVVARSSSGGVLIRYIFPVSCI